MKISVATWNVNSIKTRLHQLLPWLKEAGPDIVLLQETKVMNENFPAIEIEDLGYNLLIHGQKSYNGVAILSKFPLEVERTALPGDEGDVQCRYIEAVVSIPGGAVRAASVYVPNGQEVGSDKFAYKLKFLERLAAHGRELLALEEMTVLGGDFNVAPEAIDVYAPQTLEGTVCYHPDERARLRAVMHQGWYDAYRVARPGIQAFSWWDYRGNGFDAGKGMRIDHLLLSPQAVDRLEGCEIARDLRGQERPSDHVPVVGQFQVN